MTASAPVSKGARVSLFSSKLVLPVAVSLAATDFVHDHANDLRPVAATGPILKVDAIYALKWDGP